MAIPSKNNPGATFTLNPDRDDTRWADVDRIERSTRRMREQNREAERLRVAVITGAFFTIAVAVVIFLAEKGGF